MRMLTEAQMLEFEKTFNFIDAYIGCAVHYGAETIFNIKFDGKIVNQELINFVNDFNKVPFIKAEDSLEATNNFKTYNALKKINRLFNSHATQHKKNIMQRLIRWCNKNKVQPHRLRVLKFSNYYVEEPISFQNDVTIIEYKN